MWREHRKVFLLNGTDMFVIDHTEKCAIKKGLLSSSIYLESFWYCIVGTQECFVINHKNLKLISKKG